jgi:hypothetical protein
MTSNIPHDGLSRSRLFPDRLFVRVPWAKAEWLRNRFKERGLATTVCYESRDRIAGLEFGPNAEPRSVLQGLRELCAELE